MNGTKPQPFVTVPERMLDLKNPLGFLLSRKEEEDKVQNRKLFNYGLGLAGQNVTYGYVSG